MVGSRAFFTSIEKRAALRLQHQFMYGAREVIFEHLNLDLNKIILGVVQHGFGPDFWAETNFPSPRLGIGRARVLLASTPISIRLQKKYPHHKVEAIGSPWAYLLKTLQTKPTETLENQRIKYCKSGLRVLFFVRHFNLRAGFKYTEEIVHEIGHQIREYYPSESITFCIFWSDLLSYDWFRFGREFDIRIACAGVRELSPPWELHEARTKFLPQLARLILEHDMCAFDTYSSAVPYALSLGRRSQLIALQYSKKYPPFGKAHDWFRSEFTFTGNDELFPEKNLDLTEDLLGLNEVLSPEQFEEIIPMIKLRIL
jgi:hypothetical protein